MKILFESQDLWSVIEEGVFEPENPTALSAQQTNILKENRRKDKKALYLIYQAVDEHIFERISTSESSKEAWEMLYKSYKGEERVKIVRLQTLRCEFDNLKMKETESVEEYYTRVIILLNQLRLNGESIDDRRVVEKILRSLTRKFEYIVVSIEESKDLSDFSLETLLGTLQSHELRMKQFDTPVVDHVFQTQSSWDGSTSNRQRNFESAKEDQYQGNFKGKAKGKSFYQVKCFYCDKIGHTIKFCRKRLAEENKTSSFIHKEDSKEDDSMFMMLSVQNSPQSDLWYLDSGCSNHMTGNKDLFISLKESEKKRCKDRR